MQYILVGFLSSGISILSAALMTLSINSRHVFYGLSFIEKFKAMGASGPYMILTLTDETYSLLCSTEVPDEYDEKRVFLLISSLNHFYWIAGTVAGSVLGEFILFNTKGIDFAMTSLFVVIFVEQWRSTTIHIPALTGLVGGIAFLLLFGASKFILPALIFAVIVLCLFKNTIKKQEAQNG